MRRREGKGEGRREGEGTGTVAHNKVYFGGHERAHYTLSKADSQDPSKPRSEDTEINQTPALKPPTVLERSPCG